MDNNTYKPETVLCIPGNWKDQTEIVSAISKNNGNEFILAGMTLLNLKTNQGFEVQICEQDERMKDSFEYAGAVNGISEKFLQEIERHKSVIYVIAETGDLASAKAVAEAGNAILKSGGIGIKVESAGKAFTKEHWSGLLDEYVELNLYKMFVIDSVNENGRIFSCGMHNLGFKDCIAYEEDLEGSENLISLFGHYLFVDRPEIKNNQTFSINSESEIFIISEERNQPYKGDELFENPFGMWKLEKKA